MAMSAGHGNSLRGEAGGGNGPGGETQSAWRRGKSFAEVLGSNLPTNLTKNILEVVLEKDEKGAFMVSDEDCARLLRKLGLDTRPGVQVEGVQICPTGRGVILITLKKNVRVEDFCRYDVFQISESGIRSSMIKPAGKKEVVITMKGIHPNTLDNTVLDYLAKFGKVVTTKVVHGVFTDGPLRGMKNGDRSFKIELKAGENVGSYHVIDGQKVSLKYPGQQQTCGNCHETPRKCKGGGIAKRCKAEGGERIDFTDYILALWHKIGYNPQNISLPDESETENESQVESFTPAKNRAAEEVYAGVNIRQFPKDYDQGEVTEFLCRNGLAEENKDNIIFKQNGSVTVTNLDNETSKQIIEAIHGKQNFGRKLYCNGFVPFTPSKVSPHTEQSPDQHAPANQQPTSLTKVAQAGSPLPGREDFTRLSGLVSTTPSAPATVCAGSSETEEYTPLSESVQPNLLGHVVFPREVSYSPSSPTPRSTSTISPLTSLVGKSPTMSELFVQTFLTNDQVVRRHSISLDERPPPKGSVAAELLSTPRPDLSRAKLLVSELKESLSDFGSCVSNTSDDEIDGCDTNSTSNAEENDVLSLSLNQKKRLKKSKRKLKITPGKEQFMKRPNIATSPSSQGVAKSL